MCIKGEVHFVVEMQRMLKYNAFNVLSMKICFSHSKLHWIQKVHKATKVTHNQQKAELCFGSNETENKTTCMGIQTVPRILFKLAFYAQARVIFTMHMIVN